MSFINIEVKAKTGQQDLIREYLLKHAADFHDTDHQTDTYFNIPNGRLKLRQGNIENTLIYYERSDQPGPKQSACTIIEIADTNVLKDILTKSIGVKVVVKKKREIYFINNIKFHIDYIEQLGNFVEIEASNKNHMIAIAQLQEQCDFYKKEFCIRDEDSD